MQIVARFRSYARSLLHRNSREDDIQQEIAFHIAARAEDHERSGLSHAEALRQARIEFGSVEVHRDGIRHALGLRWFDELRGDLRYAWRMLLRSKGFTVIAIGSLALGIGANTIIFSLAKGVLLDRLAVPHPEQLRFLSLVCPGPSPVHDQWGTNDGNEMLQLTYPIYQLLQQQNRQHPVLQDIFAFKFLNPESPLTATFDGHAELVTGQMVSGNFYRQLGIQPQLGRGILPSDDGAPGSGNVVVLSDGAWLRLFDRSPSILGKTIEINFTPMTILGVNPPGFTGAGSVQQAPDIFFPLSMQPVLAPMGKTHPSVLDSKDLFWVQTMARSKPGVSDATAQVALQTWLEQDIRATMTLAKDETMPSLKLGDGSRGMQQSVRNFSVQLYMLLTLTGLVLLLACANLANLLLARSAVRQREMAVRLALGASRTRVLRQVLTESLLLSTLGGIAGLVLGYLGRNLIPHLYNPPWSQGMIRGDFDVSVALFTVGVSMLTGVLFGILPAWQSMRTPVNNNLKDAAASATRRRKGFAGRSLVILQVALSMLLVICAGLFGATLRHLYQESSGLNADQLTLFSIEAPQTRYPAPKDVQLHQRIEQRLRQVPGVSDVTLSIIPVLSDGAWNTTLHPTGQPDRPGREGDVMVNEIGDSFFNVYRIPLLFGRAFQAQDDASAPPVAIVNKALADKFWPKESPLGKTLRDGPQDKPRIITVVGVVGNAKYDRLNQVPPATIYYPYAQSDEAAQMTYVVRSPLPASTLEPQLRSAVAEIDRDLPLRDFRSQQQQIDATTSQQRTFAFLTGAYGVLALVLACIGIYGLMAYDVARRTSEIGIRMALGARASQMLAMVLREASWMALAGIALGLGGALWLSQFIKSMLYELMPNDPWVLTGAGVLLLAVALLAGLGPARRAAGVEPMEALRHE